MTAITMTGERLVAMYDNDMGVYVTPGAEDAPYWASRPNFQNDYCILACYEILDRLSAEAGYDVEIDDIRDDEAEYTIEVR